MTRLFWRDISRDIFFFFWLFLRLHFVKDIKSVVLGRVSVERGRNIFNGWFALYLENANDGLIARLDAMQHVSSATCASLWV